MSTANKNGQGWFHRGQRWMYRQKRPNQLARFLNRIWAVVHASGIAPGYMATLQVIGRKSGRIISLPVILALHQKQHYLVSMLGDQAQWVLNVRAAEGKAFLWSGRRREVQLEEVPVEQRASIIKAYLHRAPGGRPHIPVSKDAPLAEFEAHAAAFPVFKIVPRSPEVKS